MSSADSASSQPPSIHWNWPEPAGRLIAGPLRVAAVLDEALSEGSQRRLGVTRPGNGRAELLEEVEGGRLPANANLSLLLHHWLTIPAEAGTFRLLLTSGVR